MSDQENTETPSAPATQQYVSARMMYQSLLIVSVAVSLLTVFVYHSFVAVRFASFDLLSYATKLRDAQAAGKLTPQQVDQMLETIRQQIDALPPKYVVISGDAILGNAPKVEKLDLR